MAPQPQAPNFLTNPLVSNAVEGVKAEFASKIPLLMAAEAQRIGGVVVNNQLFKTRAEAEQYIAQVKAAGGPMASQIDLLVADFSALGDQESRIKEDAALGSVQLTEGQKLAKQADTQRLIDLGGDASGGIASGYNKLNLLLQSDSMRASTALDEELNPEQARIRKALGASVESDLALGNTLSDGQRRNAEQAIRSGQAARGNILGGASLLQEADGLMMEGERQQNIRQARGYAFLDGGGRKTNLFGTTSAEGSGLEESMVNDNQSANFGGIDANAGWQGIASLPNQPPPKKKKSNGWGALLGTVAGGVLGAMTGGLGYAAAGAIAGAMSKSNGGGNVGQASNNFEYPNVNF